MRPDESLRRITCSFSGHRPEKLPWKTDDSSLQCLDLRARLEASVARAYESGKKHFICGMARGCDLYFFEAVLLLRTSRGDVRLEAAVPCPTQSSAWPSPYKKRYSELIAQSDLISVISDKYSQDCMQRRNRYMIQNSSMLICVYDGSSGGTSRTIEYARNRGLEIEILPSIL